MRDIRLLEINVLIISGDLTSYFKLICIIVSHMYSVEGTVTRTNLINIRTSFVLIAVE